MHGVSVARQVINQPMSTDIHPDLRTANQRRFSRDLEFASALSNPHYLHQLSEQGVLDDPSFLRYLNYLEYLRQPSFAKYLVYPQALRFLDLLKHEDFRRAVADSAWPHDTAAKQIAHWATWRREGDDGATSADRGPA